jgi:hypothetical protein
MVNSIRRKLIAIHCSVRKDQRLIFRYKVGRWEHFESLTAWDIREALRTTMERVEEAVPGTVAKAAAIDDENWKNNKRRSRRYIAESPDLLYIDSPHLESQSEGIAGYFVVTNIPWRDFPGIVRLLCQAAEIRYGSVSDIAF